MPFQRITIQRGMLQPSRSLEIQASDPFCLRFQAVLVRKNGLYMGQEAGASCPCFHHILIISKQLLQYPHTIVKALGSLISQRLTDYILEQTMNAYLAFIGLYQRVFRKICYNLLKVQLISCGACQRLGQIITALKEEILLNMFRRQKSEKLNQLFRAFIVDFVKGNVPGSGNRLPIKDGRIIAFNKYFKPAFYKKGRIFLIGHAGCQHISCRLVQSQRKTAQFLGKFFCVVNVSF